MSLKYGENGKFVLYGFYHNKKKLFLILWFTSPYM